VERVRHRRVDPLAAAHEGPRQDRGGGRAVRIVVAEDADPGGVVDEGRGPPRAIEQALGRQIIQALDHGPPTSLADPRASRDSLSRRAGRRATCITGTDGGCATRSIPGRVGCSGPADDPSDVSHGSWRVSADWRDPPAARVWSRWKTGPESR